MSAPHIQRCTYVEVRGGVGFQCRAQDPHPDQPHDLPPDAEFGRNLDTARPEWLAATLRDRVAVQRNMQRRIDDLQAIALQLAAAWAGSGPIYGWELPDLSADWLRANAPSIAERLGLDA